MFVRQHGTAGPPVIVNHGGPAAVGDVAPVARELSAAFCTFEPWQRGSGSEPLTVASHVADLRELVREVTASSDLQPALVGHSWGGMLALCFAAAHPTECGPVALIGCGTFDTAARRSLEEVRDRRLDASQRETLVQINRLADPVKRMMQRHHLQRQVYDYCPAEPYPEKEEFEPFDLKAHNETWADMTRLIEDRTYPRAFDAILTPVAMFHGNFDPHPGKLIRDSLLPHIPGLEYREFKNCGHSPWIEKYARAHFFLSLSQWLGTYTSRSANALE
ncbi:MAG: alpha/beta hydrolase [Pseudomonadota bacterium]